ncbi:hypothetical protein SAMN05877753_10735 [Bacillus oleivorans]|uniref:Copper amine oxidase-like protein n=1 Tax=Bacillus oleivorans TaxID=1448271 RepID=A0A285D0L5_9BACI|nr:hypothetical protein [Bacillus oleivorans]SNX73350.1 hypothetical protein SAMN05877753_10735 [Bacillus oleivorans]
MRRFFVSLMFISLIFIGVFLYIQWFDFTKSAEETSQMAEEGLIQTISITREQAILKVEQQVSGINGNSLSYIVPNGVQDIQCLDEENQPCRLNHNVIEQADAVKFQYVVPMEGKTFLFNEWVHFPDVKISETTVEIIEPLPFKGFWTSTAPLFGHTQQETISYYQFQSDKGSVSLFRSEELLQMASIGPIQIFGSGSNGSLEKSEVEKWVEKFPQFGQWNIVFSDLSPAYYTKGLLIVPSTTTSEALRTILIRTYIKDSFIVDDTLDPSFSGLIASILLEEEIQSESVYQKLLQNLSEIEREKLQSVVISQFTKTITPAWLDEQIFKIKGLKTTFLTDHFEKGIKGELLFFDPRPVTGFNRSEKEILTLIDNGLRYYPLLETMNLIGYEVNQVPKQKLVEIKKEGHIFQFSTDQPILLENDSRYVLTQFPLSYFNNELFMEEGWLRRLFTLDVIMAEDSIHLKDLP